MYAHVYVYMCVCMTLYVCNGRACSQRGGGVEGLMNQASIKSTSKLPSFTNTMSALSLSLSLPPSLDGAILTVIYFLDVMVGLP